MPELPEVETVRRTLVNKIAGEVIAGVDVRFPGCIGNMEPEAFEEKVKGRAMRGVERRGKYLLVRLDDGAILLVHLRMTGRLTAPDQEGDDGDERYLRMAFLFASGRRLCFHDVRKFGRVEWHKDDAALDARLRIGPDPTSGSFGPDTLARIAAGRKRPIKSLLMDQALIGGLGNIYADEALHRAGIAPERRADGLAREEVEQLCLRMQEVLLEGIEHKGTSLRDYVDGDGRPGAFQERLRVYGRAGKPCIACGEPIRRIKIGGRSSFFCPRCQA